MRVYPFKLSPAYNRAKRLRPLLTGIQTTSGRHGGCRLRFDSKDRLYVGTGDAAVNTNPQNTRSLNGKVLRLSRITGKPSPENPWSHAVNKNRRYVYTYGHRNVQGLAFRGRDQHMWSVEHGSTRDDEVNRLARGGNYGWDPGPGYDESTPMTEHSLPGRQISARWRSGNSTIATSGAVWVRGDKWGAYEGTLAVCALKASKLVFMKFSKTGTAALDEDAGRDERRLRSASQRGAERAQQPARDHFERVRRSGRSRLTEVSSSATSTPGSEQDRGEAAALVETDGQVGLARRLVVLLT